MNRDRIIMQCEAFEFPTLRTLPYFTTSSEENRFIELHKKTPHTIDANELNERKALTSVVVNADWFAGSFSYNDPMASVLYKDYEVLEED